MACWTVPLHSTTRCVLDLPTGHTAFRDATDFLAKTHGLRAQEAGARLRLAATLTPTRSTDEERTLDVGEVDLPALGAFQGRVHPGRLASAVSMLNELDQHAEAAGKSPEFRKKLRRVTEQDLAGKMVATTPEEFGRYVSQRKKDLLAGLAPADGKFRPEHTELLYDVRRIGPVRGNRQAIEYVVIVDPECDEVLQTYLMSRTNPRGKDERDSAFDQQHRGHRRMVALRDALKFVVANPDRTGFRGASGAYANLLVMIDYPTLLAGVQREFENHLPEVSDAPRDAKLPQLTQPQPTDDRVLAFRQHPPSKTTHLDQILEDHNLDRLQPRISRGIYNSDIPPETLLILLCDISVIPVTLTGDRRVLSIGRAKREFPEHIRRAIQARDRGCAAPGCHIPAALCEIHHAKYWQDGGDTSTANGVLLCSHHHAAVHANALQILRVDGEFRFLLDPKIDPAQQPRVNYFFQV